METLSQSNPQITRHLTELLRDWQASRAEFPKNTVSAFRYPIPFLGQPAQARIATVSAHPCHRDLAPERRWADLKDPIAWQHQVREYFKSGNAPDRWFSLWDGSLPMLGASYADGTAMHLNLSYRPLIATLRDEDLNRAEYRRMLERDVAWAFRLLPLCPELRLLLVAGSVCRADKSAERLVDFLLSRAAQHGFMAGTDAPYGMLSHRATGKIVYVHEAASSATADLASCIVQNLQAHRRELLQRLGHQHGARP